jgi:hypothetical protein
LAKRVRLLHTTMSIGMGALRGPSSKINQEMLALSAR